MTVLFLQSVYRLRTQYTAQDIFQENSLLLRKRERKVFSSIFSRVFREILSWWKLFHFNRHWTFMAKPIRVVFKPHYNSSSATKWSLIKSLKKLYSRKNEEFHIIFVDLSKNTLFNLLSRGKHRGFFLQICRKTRKFIVSTHNIKTVQGKRCWLFMNVSKLYCQKFNPLIGSSTFRKPTQIFFYKLKLNRIQWRKIETLFLLECFLWLNVNYR